MSRPAETSSVSTPSSIDIEIDVILNEGEFPLSAAYKPKSLFPNQTVVQVSSQYKPSDLCLRNDDSMHMKQCCLIEEENNIVV